VRNDSQHLLVVRSLLVLQNVLFLAVQNLVLNVSQIVIFNILLQDLANIRELILVNKLNPVGSSDAVTFALRVSLVAEDSSLIEGAVKCSDNSALGVSDHILLLLIDLISNVALTSLDENNFINLVKLLEQNSSSILLSWF